MKTCKRFLAVMLALTLLSTMLTGTIISVNADLISNVDPASTEETVIALWDAEYAAKDLNKTGSSAVNTALSSDTVTVGSALYLAGAAEVGATLTRDTTIEEGNTVFNITTDLLQNNYRALIKTFGTNGDNVLAFSSRLQIPSTQPTGITKTDVTRSWNLPMEIKGGDAYTSATTYLALTANIDFSYDDNGNLVASAAIDKNVSSATNIPVVVKEDEWIDLDVQWFLEDGKKPFIAIYINNKMAYSATASKVYNKSVTTTSTDETTGEETSTTTNYYPAFALIKFEAKTNQLATTYLDEFKITSHNIKTLPILSIATVASATVTGAKGKTATIYGATGIWAKNLLQGSATSTETVYTRDTETVANETVINLSQSADGMTRMVSNIREPITEYIDTTDPVYLESEFDLYVPEGTEGNTKEYYLSTVSSVRDEGANNDTTFKKPGANIYSTLRDGKLNIASTVNGNAEGEYALVKFSEKSETADVGTNQWVNIKYVQEITGAEETGYNVKVYGILNDTNLIYTAEWEYPAGEYGINQVGFDFTNSTGAAANTKIDNINIALQSSYTIPEKTWNLVDYAYPMYFVQDGANVKAEVLILKSSLTAADIVIAFYDANGKLIAPVTKSAYTNTAGADFAISETVEIPAGAVTAKAFLFDNIASTKALVENVKITLE